MYVCMYHQKQSQIAIKLTEDIQTNIQTEDASELWYRIHNIRSFVCFVNAQAFCWYLRAWNCCEPHAA